MPAPVLTKQDFVRRFLRHEFGNKTFNWDTLDEYLASGYRGLVHIRNRVAGGPTYYDLPAGRVASTWRRVVDDHRNYYLASMAPTDKTTLQGEVQRSVSGLQLYYSTLALPMREALAKQAACVSGIISNSLLRHYMDVTSYDWLNYLLDAYPDHIVEFSTFSEPCGTLAWNTLFWEVRLY